MTPRVLGSEGCYLHCIPCVREQGVLGGYWVALFLVQFMCWACSHAVSEKDWFLSSRIMSSAVKAVEMPSRFHDWLSRSQTTIVETIGSWSAPRSPPLPPPTPPRRRRSDQIIGGRRAAGAGPPPPSSQGHTRPDTREASLATRPETHTDLSHPTITHGHQPAQTHCPKTRRHQESQDPGKADVLGPYTAAALAPCASTRHKPGRSNRPTPTTSVHCV
eukprot:scaffold10484_cov31-Tisochrysis_lutea.AAC.4